MSTTTDVLEPTTEATTEITTDVLALPAEGKSRLKPAPKPRPAPAERVDDVVTADERIKAFRRAFKTGRIVTHVREFGEPPVVAALAGEVLRDGVKTYIVTAFIYREADDDEPAAIGTAARSTDDPDEIVRQFALETAETAAISRGLRFLGLKLK